MKHSLKITTLAALVASASMLTACSGGTSSQSSSESNPPQTSASTTEQTSAPEAEQTTAAATEQTSSESSAPEEGNTLPITLLAPDGYEIKPSDISQINGENGEMTPEQLTEGNWYSLECSTFCFAAEPTGFTLSSFEGTMTEDTELPEYTGNPYKRICVGDTICGFTVTEAHSTFTSPANSPYALTPFVGGYITLAETAQLTGWARLAPADDVYTIRGDVEFIPDSSSAKLPVVNFRVNDSGELETRIWACASESAYWANEYPDFKIGNINEETTDADLSMLYDDGTYTRVKITLDNISLSSMIDFYSMVYAHIADIEAI